MAIELRLSEQDAAVPVRVIRSARRKRTVSFGVVAGEVVVRAPARMTNAQVRELLDGKRRWIAGRLASGAMEAMPRAMVDGARLPYLGREIELRFEIGGARRASVALVEDTLVISSSTPPSEPATRALVVRWYRGEALRVFSDYARKWSEMAGLTPSRLLVRDQRRRWGSCGPDGTLRLNWRLVLAESSIIEYVVVHELAHLRHKHHQAAFWDEVEKMLPDFRERRRRLGEVGPGLVL